MGGPYIVRRTRDGDGATDDPTTARLWSAAERDFETFMEDAGVTDDLVTWTTEILLRDYEGEDQALRQVRQGTMGDGEWIVIQEASGSSNKVAATAVPVTHGGPHAVENAPFMHIHSLLAAWWLSTVWRLQELSAATRALYAQDLAIAAAATARCLVETVAAFDYDARRIRNCWATIKSARLSCPAEESWDQIKELDGLLRSVLYGGRFEHAPLGSVEASYHSVGRTNVLTQVRHLAKRVDGVPLQPDYDWLCNVVHPSVGTMKTYASTAFAHDAGTHADRMWSRVPMVIVGRDGTRTDPRLTDSILARSSVVALQVGLESLRAALRIVDDVALASDAPSLNRRAVFRPLRPVDRNERCPCGSGRKWKQCEHQWGCDSPELPARYEPRATNG